MLFKISSVLFDNFKASRCVVADSPEQLTKKIGNFVKDFWDDMPAEYAQGMTMTLMVDRIPETPKQAAEAQK